MAELIGDTEGYSTWGRLRFPLVNMFNAPGGVAAGPHNREWPYCFYITDGFCFNTYANDGTLNYYTTPQVGDGSGGGYWFGFSAWEFGGLKATGNIPEEYLNEFVGQTATDGYGNSATISADAWNNWNPAGGTWGQTVATWFDPPLTIGLMTRSW